MRQNHPYSPILSTKTRRRKTDFNWDLQWARRRVLVAKSRLRSGRNSPMRAKSIAPLHNPPTSGVLYDDACQRILASPKLARYLDGTTPRFHLDPPSVVRPRHRNRHVNSSLRVDAAGREHIYLNFYLQSHPESPSWVDRATTWTQDKVYLLSELSWDQLLDRSRQSLSVAWAKTHELARYLSGAPSMPPIPPPTDTTKPAAAESTSYFGSMFSSLRRPRGRTFESKPEVEAHGQFNEGEVHVAYVKNNAGEFVLRYILVELPNSKVKNPVRVFVERAPGVRDTEAVMHWSSAH
uniref:Mitochondrial import inner membrane translocase subunit Tim21 n=1 Tax=Mycena chlorophos TaxID=658473 RepID=A0ABQ0LF12_MYCCL|nr:predicted protein [Mycena chlorophos]